MANDTLIPPKIGPEFIEEKVTCIRPYREGLFKISSEIKNGKLIVHDYGHGGAGWTLLFGSVNRALLELENQLAVHPEFLGKAIRVIGAGAHGMMVAIALKERGFEVSIVAKDFEELTSHKGAGIFAPGSMELSPDEEQIRDRVLVDSYSVWKQIAGKKHPHFRQGGEFMPLYVGENTDPGLESLIRSGDMPQPVFVNINFLGGQDIPMMKYESIFMDTELMLNQFHHRADDLGIRRERIEIRDFSHIDEEIIFDCAGLGAKWLNRDENMIPVQGHLITLRDQPPIEDLRYMIYAKINDVNNTVDDYGNSIDNYFYFTRKKGGTLGGTYIKGEGGLNTNRKQHRLILQRALNFFGGEALSSDEKPY